MMAGAMLIFGSIGLFVRQIPLSSGQIALARGFLGTLFLLIWYLISSKNKKTTVTRRQWLLLALSGAGIGFNWILLFESYRFTSVANATLGYYFAPVLVVWLSPLLLKEKLTPLRAICTFVAVGGMFLVAGAHPSAADLKGISLALGASALYASVILTNQFIRGLPGLLTTVIQLGMATVVLFPYVLFTDGIPTVLPSADGLIWLLIVGIVHTGFSYLLYFSSMQKLSAQTVAAFSYIDPVSAVLMSALILQEPMTWMQAVGGVLILASTFLSQRRSANER